MKTFLSSHNVTVEYELAEKEIIPYTPEQQSVIDEIIKDGTYKEVTHYTAEASLNPDMDIEYYTKTNVPTTLAELQDDSTHRLVTDTEKSTWNEKGTYSKPSGGIPKTDLESTVQTSLGKADTAVQNDDLTNYVQDTDYATNSKGGVIKVGSGLEVNSSNGYVFATNYNYQTYGTASNNNFISKGTLENVITGKGLVSDTDYATTSKGGVIKPSGSYKVVVTAQGDITCYPTTYNNYEESGDYIFISKGTLENVITGKELVSKSVNNLTNYYTKTEIDNIVGDINEVIDQLNGEVI